MEKFTILEGFYLNNVKYIKCPAAQGAAIMNRQNKNSYLLGKLGLKQRADFENRRDWIFADREENETTSELNQDNGGSNTRGSSPVSGGRTSPGRDAELTTKFRSANWSTGVFHKLRICIVDIQEKKKPAFRKIIETNGGKAMMDLSKNKVDILLAPHPSGINFKNAKLWGVACIHPHWIEKSVDATALLPLDRYRVVEDSENLSPLPSLQGAQSKTFTSVGSIKDEEASGCFNFQGRISIEKTPLAIRSKCESKKTKEGKNTASRKRITNDTFNVSTRL